MAERDDLAPILRALDHDGVVEAAQRGQREAGIELDLQRQQVVPAAIRSDRAEEVAGIFVGRRDGNRDRKSVGSGKRVSVSVDLGGRRNIKKKTDIMPPPKK